MNREQFTELVKREQEELRRFLLALCCGDRFLADDIAQEALVKAYLSCAGYQEQGHFVAWLYRIAHNTFLDHKRKEKNLNPLEEACALCDEALLDSYLAGGSVTDGNIRQLIAQR